MKDIFFRLKNFLTKLQGWQIAIGFLWLFYFIFLHLNSFSSPLHPDEGEYAYSAWLMKQGKTLYQDAFIQKPPLIVYTYFFGQLFDPGGVWSPRFLAFLFTLSSSVLLSMIAKKEWGQRAGFLALWLYPAINLFPGFTPYTANTEKFLLLPLIGLLTVAVFHKNFGNRFWFLVAGCLFALTFWYKPIALLLGLLILGVWFWKLWQKSKRVDLVFGGAVFALAGFLVISGLVLIPFFWSGSFGALWNAVFAFNRYYATSGYFSPLNFFWFGFALFRYWWVLGLGVLFFVFGGQKRKFFYGGLFLFALVNILSFPFGHYYILIAPFLCLVVVSGFDGFLKGLERLSVFKTHWTTAVLLAAVLTALFWPFYGRFFLSAAELSQWLYSRDFLDSVEVAKQITKRSKPWDKIFVTCSEPQIYFYAKRQSASRFIILFPLNIKSPYQNQYENEVKENLFEDKPRFIVSCNLDEHQGYWGEIPPRISHQLFYLLQKDYRLIGGYQKQDKNNSWWEASGKIDKDLIHKSNYLDYHLVTP